MTEEGTVIEFNIYGEFADELHGVLPSSAQRLIVQAVETIWSYMLN